MGAWGKREDEGKAREKLERYSGRGGRSKAEKEVDGRRRGAGAREGKEEGMEEGKEEGEEEEER